MFGLVRGLCIIAAFVSSGASSGHAQTDFTAVKQAVRECVAQVRQEATRRENYDQFGTSLILGTPGGLMLTVLHLPLVSFMIRREERQLEQSFGDTWREYAQRTRRWI